MTSRRILYCESNADGTVGGSFYSLLFLVQGLDRKRYEPLVVFYRDHALVPVYREAGIDTRILPRPAPFQFASRLAAGRGLFALPGKLLVPAQKLANLWRFLLRPVLDKYRYLRRERIDLVHLNNSIIRNNDWMLAARLAGIPCMTHERGINRHYPRLARWLAPRLEAIVCISSAVADNLRHHGIPDHNFRIIFNGLDPDRVQASRSPQEVREAWRIPPAAPVIGMVGNIKEWKGQKSVILAVAELKGEFPDLRCFLVGDTAEADQPYRDRLEQLIREHRLQDNIIFTGYQSCVADFVNATDVVVHASVLPEPFGRVLIEAMALGKPLVGARDGAVPEIIVEGETGLMFTPDDPTDLARCIRQLLRDPETAKRMGTAGYRRLQQQFSIGSNIKKTTAIYDKVFRTR